MITNIIYEYFYTTELLINTMTDIVAKIVYSLSEAVWCVRHKMAALVPGFEGSSIMEQIQKIFEPPGGDNAER